MNPNMQFCQECGQEVPKSSKFCKYCQFPFTKEAEAKLQQLKNKPKAPPPPPEPDIEDEDDDTEGISQANSPIEVGEGLEIEGLYVDRPQKVTFEKLIFTPKDQGFTPRPLNKINKKTFQKEWQAEAGSSRKTQ